MSRLPALGELLDLLRAEGFAIGVDDHLRVGRLLALDADWSEAELRGVIRSVIAKSAQEHVAFDAVWTRLFAARRPVRSQADLSPAASSEQRLRRPLVLHLLVGLLAGLSVSTVAATVIRWQWPSQETAVPDAGGETAPSAPVAPIDAPAADASVVDAPATDASVVDAPIIAQTTGPTGTTTQPDRDDEPVESPVASREYVDPAMLLVGGVLLAGAFAIGGIQVRRRKRFIPGPWRYLLRAPAVTRPVLPHDAVLDGAAYLSWKIDSEAPGEVDADRSAHATAETGGAPMIVYRSPPAAPKYLVLEDMEGGSERWRFLYDELLRGLAREGIEITRYTFTGNPSSCTSIDGRECCELRDLVEHYDALIVIGDGDAAFDPIEGTPADWLPLLHHVPRRLWLNPIPQPRWSRGAQAIARDTPMEHTIARGLAALQNAGTDRRRPPVPSFPWVIERAPETSTGFGALQHYLGPAGMRAIAAVAMAGRPSIAVLRWMVDHFQLALDEVAWLRVTALPWFRSAAWPKGLQARLVAWLQARDTPFAGKVTKAMIDLLVADEPAPGSTAHLRWELELAAARVRAGDRAGMSAAIQKVGATALYREVSRQIPAASLERTGWRIRAPALLGAVLCGLAGLHLALSEEAPVALWPEPLPIIPIFGNTSFDDSNIEVQYTIKPPDPNNSTTKGDAPQFEVTVIGAPNLTADKFLLIDKSVKPPFEMKAASKRGFLQGNETLAVAIVMLGWEQWIGNTSYRGEDDPTRVVGVLVPLEAALDKLNFKEAGPPGSVGMVITYATKAEIKLPMGPLDRLSGAALGTEKDYMGTTGLELVKGIERALAELKKVSNPRKVLIIITDGNDSNADAAKVALQQLKKQAQADHVQVSAIIYAAPESGPNTVILNVFPSSTVNTVDNIAVAVNAILQRMADRQYLTFPGFDKERKLGFKWDGKPHDLAVKIDKDETEPVAVPMAPIWRLHEDRGFTWLIVIGVGVLIVVIVGLKVLKR